MHTEMLIGAKFEKGTEAGEPVLNPKTGATILELPEASPAQIEAAVAAAEKAFASWSRTTPAERSACLLKIADRIEADAAEFARLEALTSLLTARTEAPAVVVGAIVHGELLALRPFGWGDGIVARAAERLTLMARGLDPNSLVPTQLGHEQRREHYAAALRGYMTGTPEGVAGWVVHCAQAVMEGARDSLATCEAIRRATTRR